MECISMVYWGHAGVCGGALQRMEDSLYRLRVLTPFRVCVEFLLHGYG